MYELGYRSKKRPYKLIGLGLCVLLLVCCIGAYKALHLTAAPQGAIRNDSSHTTNYQPNEMNRVAVNKPLFSMSLPAGWSEVTNAGQKSASSGDMFHSSSADARQLTVYVDDTPVNLAVNRALAVAAKGNRLAYGNVSDNCTTFTSPSKSDPGSGQANGLWQDDTFICDIGNYERDVVGTVSSDGLNYVNLASPTTGLHRVFITYADNSSNPNFGILYAILGSFQLK